MRIFLCDVGNIPQDVLKKAAARLPASRSPKKGIRADALAAHTAGTLLTVYAMKQISPETVCEIWETTPEGKPFIKGCPIEFSITHADGIVGVAVSGNHPVGLDIEKIRPMRENFAARYFSDGEREQMLAAADRDEALIRLWTAKEAVGKRNGTGLGTDIAAIDTRDAVSAVFERNGARFALSLAPKGALPPLEWVEFSKLVP